MKYVVKGNGIIVIGEDGEDLFLILKALKDAKDTPETMVVTSALGMLKEVKVGYWNGDHYEIHEFKEPVELLGISGQISKTADPFYHFHLLMGTSSGKAVGGHFLEARVCNTLELFLMGILHPIKRVKKGNLKLIEL